jgi:hypothetical protein
VAYGAYLAHDTSLGPVSTVLLTVFHHTDLLVLQAYHTYYHFRAVIVTAPLPGKLYLSWLSPSLHSGLCSNITLSNRPSPATIIDVGSYPVRLTLWRFMLRNFIVFQSVERTQMFRENHK